MDGRLDEDEKGSVCGRGWRGWRDMWEDGRVNWGGKGDVSGHMRSSGA